MSPLKVFFLSFSLTMYAVYYFSVKKNTNIEKNTISIESLKKTKEVLTKVIQKNDTSKDIVIFKELHSKKNENKLTKQINQKEKAEKKVLLSPKNDSKIDTKKSNNRPLSEEEIINNENKLYPNTVPISTITPIILKKYSNKASIKKGQRIFRKKLRKYCTFSGVRFAKKHTQDEWEEIWNKGNFKSETKKICPRLELRKIKRSWWKHIYIFVYTYGLDERVHPY